MDIFHMSRAQLAGLAIGTLRMVSKAHPNSSKTRDEDAGVESDGEGSNGDNDGEEEEESFDVEEIAPSSYVHMRTPISRQPQNLDWREKISYKGKIELVREKRKENPRLKEKEVGIIYKYIRETH
jgi:hypothetical protein